MNKEENHTTSTIKPSTQHNTVTKENILKIAPSRSSKEKAMENPSRSLKNFERHPEAIYEAPFVDIEDAQHIYYLRSLKYRKAFSDLTKCSDNNI